MENSGTNPKSPMDEVLIVHGYPSPPPTPTKSSGAAHDQASECRPPLRKIKPSWVVIPLVVFVLGVMLYYGLQDDFPRFQLDSVSFSVHANNTAIWDIDFSIDRPVGDLDVWVRFMSRDYKAQSPGMAGDSTVSVMSTLLPRGTNTNTSFPGEVRLEQVVFQCNNCDQKGLHYVYVVKAACKDVTVVEGGPRLCPVIYHNLLH